MGGFLGERLREFLRLGEGRGSVVVDLPGVAQTGLNSGGIHAVHILGQLGNFGAELLQRLAHQRFEVRRDLVVVEHLLGLGQSGSLRHLVLADVVGVVLEIHQGEAVGHCLVLGAETLLLCRVLRRGFGEGLLLGLQIGELLLQRRLGQSLLLGHLTELGEVGAGVVGRLLPQLHLVDVVGGDGRRGGFAVGGGRRSFSSLGLGNFCRFLRRGLGAEVRLQLVNLGLVRGFDAGRRGRLGLGGGRRYRCGGVRRFGHKSQPE